MKKTFLCLCALLAYAGSMFAAVAGTQVMGKLTCVDDGDSISVDFPFYKISVDSLTMTGTIGVGYPFRDTMWYMGDTEGYRTALKGEVVVPETITIGDITYTVNAIGLFAFGYVRAFDELQYTSVTLPKSITTINQFAFYYSPIKSINLPSALTSIGGQAFYACANLSQINVEERNTPYDIGSKAFEGCTSLTTVDNLLAYAHNVGDLAFSGCTGLTSVIIDGDYENENDSVPLCRDIRFGKNPFAYCSNLENLSVTTDWYFSYGGWDLDDRPLNAIVYWNDDYLALTVVTATNNTTNLDIDLIEHHTNIHPLEIGAYAYAGCTNLTALEFKDNVYSIGEHAFSGCTNLSKLSLNKITNIEDYAFENCTSLAGIILPEDIDNLPSNIFAGCTELKTVVMPKACGIGTSGLFKDCTGLTTLVMKREKPTSVVALLEAKAFKGIDRPNATLYVPEGCLDAYKAISCWRKFGQIKEMKGFDLNVTSAGLATMYVDRPLEIPEDEDLLGVFYGTSTEGNVLKMRRVKDIIPANTGVIVMANEGKYTFPFHWTEDEVTDNVISGVLEDTPKADVMSEKGYRQILTLGQGKTGSYIGFYKFTGTTLGANKAFIGLETEGSDEVKLQFEDGTETSIENLNMNDNADKGVYDLSGRRVNNPAKGLYIVNGKKVLF